MSQDLSEILTGAPAKSSAPAQAPASGSPLPNLDPMDAAVRTIYGEAPPNATKEERQAIAAVIANRAAASGSTFDKVVTENDGKTWQFEPWGDAAARKKILALKPDSPEYKAISADVGDILAGKSNPYPELRNFYAPAAQKAKNRDKPSWDDGSGVQIGAHLFFGQGGAHDDFAKMVAGDGAADDAGATQAFAESFGDPKKWDEAKADFTGAGQVTFANGLAGTLNKAQTATYEKFNKGGYLLLDDPKQAPPGSVLNPLWMPPAGEASGRVSEKDIPQGAYYVDLKGELKHNAPDKAKDGKIGNAVARGGADVLQSLGEILPGTKDSSVLNFIQSGQAAYDSDYKGDLKMGIGRFTGQMLATAPAASATEGLLGLRALGAGGEFLAGRGALEAAPKAAQLAYRGGSLAANGAIEGAEAGALTSSATDGSAGENTLTGALIGAPVKVAGAPLAKGLQRLIGGKASAAGAAPIEEQKIRVEMSKGLPVEVPMSQGDITGAPAQQMSENAMLRGAEGDGAAKVMQDFRGSQQDALRANVEAIVQKIGKRDVQVGEGGAAVSKTLNAARDALKKDIDKAYSAAREADQGAHLPRDFRPIITAELQNSVRDYTPSKIPGVKEILASLDGPQASPGAITAGQAARAPVIERPLEVRELFEAREKLTTLRGGNDPMEGGAAGKAVRKLDDLIKQAATSDMIKGDPTAVKAWRDAIKKRADFGKLFEGDDLIEDLTERVSRGGEHNALKVAPEDATNLIFNRSSLGFVGKRNLKRDLVRLRDKLGADSDEWDALRAEAFRRFAQAGEGAAEAGQARFSGQKFFNAWTKAKGNDPQIIEAMFSKDERDLIDNFAEVAQRVTSPVKGGDNPSNSAITMKKFVEKWAPVLVTTGGAGAGAALHGPEGAMAGAAMGAFFQGLREVLGRLKATGVTKGAKPIADEPRLKSKLIPDLKPAAAAVLGNRLLGGQPVSDAEDDPSKRAGR